MNGFKSSRVSAHREHCAALRRFSLGTEVYFPKRITDIVCSYYEPSEEEHFMQILATCRVSGGIDYNSLCVMTLTLDPWVCNIIFGTKNGIFPAFLLAERMKEFDADGLVDKISWYLPRFVRSEIDRECDWDMAECEHNAQQLAVGFLASYITVAKELTDTL